MRVTFKDGSTVEYVTASEGYVENFRLVLKTGEGEVIAELTLAEIESWERADHEPMPAVA